ncbi:MAG: hypothetical protein RBS57_17150, partial [Desulforhabdus sp.]|nr:hypothetical protein [Desulforhabdus sp.]
MVRRSLAVILTILLGCSLSACNKVEESSSAAEVRTAQIQSKELHLPGGDWGLPTPFTFYPRGPGYIHLSFIYDTLVWKDEKGIIPWLAASWEC